MIEILETDGDVYSLRADTPSGEIRVVTELRLLEDDLFLSSLHIEGAGRGTYGLAELRRLARELGRQFGVRRVIIQGWARTSGARPGRVPRPVVVDVEEPGP